MRKIVVVLLLLALASCASLYRPPVYESKNIHIVYHPDFLQGKVLVQSTAVEFGAAYGYRAVCDWMAEDYCDAGWSDIFIYVEILQAPMYGAKGEGSTMGVYRVSIYRDP